MEDIKNNKEKKKYYCSECGKEFTPCKNSRLKFDKGKRKNIFCSKTCMHKFFSKKFNENIQTYVCEFCGKEFTAKKKYSNHFFCSLNCSNNYHARSKYEKVVKEWKEGKEPGYIPSTGQLRKSIRKYLIEQSDYKCSKCGFSGNNVKTGNSILQINHIDGDYKNNSPENLEVLCPNCHAMTETYGSLNSGRGRPQRYKDKNKD